MSIAIVAATFVVSLVSGFVPLVNVELYLLGLAAAQPDGAWAPVVLAAALGQVAAKCVLYALGFGARRSSNERARAVAAAAARLRAAGPASLAVVFSSALVGLPPFYVTSLAAGVMRLGLPAFVAFGLAGRLLRFAAVLLATRLVM